MCDLGCGYENHMLLLISRLRKLTVEMQVMKGMIRSNALMLQKLLHQNSTGTVDEEALLLQLPLQTEQEIEEA